MKQRDLFSRGRELKIARNTWIESTLEKTIVKTLRQGLAACRITVFKINAPIPCPQCNRWPCEPNEAGIPDLMGSVPPELFQPVAAWARPLLIEVKRPRGGVEDAAQKEIIDRARKGGAIAFFCRGWDECAAELRAAGVKLPEGV